MIAKNKRVVIQGNGSRNEYENINNFDIIFMKYNRVLFDALETRRTQIQDGPWAMFYFSFAVLPTNCLCKSDPDKAPPFHVDPSPSPPNVPVTAPERISKQPLPCNSFSLSTCPA